jgi:hypothetical protein
LTHIIQYIIANEVDGRLIAMVEENTHIFEVNLDSLKVKDVVLAFYNSGERVGSIYNDDGTKRTMARLETKGEEDFISVEVEKEFVSKILERAAKENMILTEETSVEAYRTRLGLDN